MKFQIECGNLTTVVEASHWTEALKKAFKKHNGWFGILARFRTYKDRKWQYVAPENYIGKTRVVRSDILKIKKRKS